jgi:hypothetical protein
VGGEKLSPPPRPQPLEGAPSELRVPVIEIDDVPDDGVAREEKVRVGDVDREAAKSVAGVVEDLEAEPSQTISRPSPTSTVGSTKCFVSSSGKTRAIPLKRPGLRRQWLAVRLASPSPPAYAEEFISRLAAYRPR